MHSAGRIHSMTMGRTMLLLLLALACRAAMVTRQPQSLGYWDVGDVPTFVPHESGQMIYDGNPDSVKVLVFAHDPSMRTTGLHLLIECQLSGAADGFFGLHAAVLAGDYANELYDADTHSHVPAHTTTDTALHTNAFVFYQGFYFYNLGVDEEASTVAFVVRANSDISMDPAAVVLITSVHLNVYYDEPGDPWGLVTQIFQWTPTEIIPSAYSAETETGVLVQYSGGYYDESETWDTLFLHLRFGGGTFYIRVAVLYIAFYEPYLQADSCLFAHPPTCGQTVQVVDGIAHVPISRSDAFDNGGADHYVAFIHTDSNGVTTQCCQFGDSGSCFGVDNCAWDWQLNVCRPARCIDLFSQPSCNTSALNCTYDTVNFKCLANVGDQPCSSFYAPTPCPADRCTYDAGSTMCYETTSGVPCSAHFTQETCPVPECSWVSPNGFDVCAKTDACGPVPEMVNPTNPLPELWYSRIVYGTVSPTDQCCLHNETACESDPFCVWDAAQSDVTTDSPADRRRDTHANLSISVNHCRALTCLDDNVADICEALGCCFWGGNCYDAVPCITTGEPPVCVEATDELCAQTECLITHSCELFATANASETTCKVRSGDPCSWHNATTCPVQRCRVHNNTDCVELCDACCLLETEQHCLAVASSCVWHQGACTERECWFYSDVECPTETCTVSGGRCRSPTQQTPCEFFFNESCPAYYCHRNTETGLCSTLGRTRCGELVTNETCQVYIDCEWRYDACYGVPDCRVSVSQFSWPIYEFCCGLSPVECATTYGCVWHDTFGSCMVQRCFNDGSCGEPCTSVDEGVCHMGDSSLCMNMHQAQCAAPNCVFDLASDKCRDVNHLPYCGMYTAETCPLDRCSITNHTLSLEPQCMVPLAECVECCSLSVDDGTCEDADCQPDEATNRCRVKTCADYSIEDGCPVNCVVLSGNGQSPMLADCVSPYDDPTPCHKRYSSDICTSPCAWNASTCAIKEAYNCGMLRSSEECSANDYCVFESGLCRSSNACPDLLPVEPCCVHSYENCHLPYCGYNFIRRLCEPRSCIHYYTDSDGCLAHGGCHMVASDVYSVCAPEETGLLYCDVYASPDCPEGCVFNETLQVCRYPNYTRPVCGAYADLGQCVADGCVVVSDGVYDLCTTTCDTPTWLLTDTVVTTTTTENIQTTPTALLPCCEFSSFDNCPSPRCGYHFAHGRCEPLACVHHGADNTSCLAHGGCHVLPVYNGYLCEAADVDAVCNVWLQGETCPPGCVQDTNITFCRYPGSTVQICGEFESQSACELSYCTWTDINTCIATCDTPPVSTSTQLTTATSTTSHSATTVPSTTTEIVRDIPVETSTEKHVLFRTASFVALACAFVVLGAAALVWSRGVESPRAIAIIKRIFS